jgi:hypothetical protein
MRRGLLLLAVVSFGVAAANAACTAEVSDPRFGPPGGLRNVQLPTPATGSSGPTPTPDGGGGGGDGGVNPQSCTVKFSTDIYPSMQPGGTWKCAETTTCHGGAGKATPLIDPNSAANAYNTLIADTSTGKPYINNKSMDPTASGMTCNLAGTCSLPMPQTPNNVGAAADPATAAKLATWLQCGAPNN